LPQAVQTDTDARPRAAPSPLRGHSARCAALPCPSRCGWSSGPLLGWARP